MYSPLVLLSVPPPTPSPLSSYNSDLKRGSSPGYSVCSLSSACSFSCSNTQPCFLLCWLKQFMHTFFFYPSFFVSYWFPDPREETLWIVQGQEEESWYLLWEQSRYVERGIQAVQLPTSFPLHVIQLCAGKTSTRGPKISDYFDVSDAVFPFFFFFCQKSDH